MCAHLTCSALFLMRGTSLALFLSLNLSFPCLSFSQVAFGHLSSIVSGCLAEAHQE